MKHWIVFPDEGGFYVGMGRELYEIEKEYRAYCRSAEKKLKLPLHHAVFYRDMEYPAHLSERQAAVMVLSLANYEQLCRTYPQAGERMLCGRGMGLLSALVAAKSLSLSAAVGRLRGKRLSARQVKLPELPVYSMSVGRLREKKQIIEAIETALREEEAWSLPEEHPCVDIGPGRVCFDALPEATVARLDEPGDPQYIWSGFQTKRLWSRDYCAKRLFGIMVATPNENEACDGKRLDAQEKEMRELLRPLYEQEPKSITDEAFARCVVLLRENFAEKHTPIEEIKLRLRLLAQETLILLASQGKETADA